MDRWTDRWTDTKTIPIGPMAARGSKIAYSTILLNEEHRSDLELTFQTTHISSHGRAVGCSLQIFGRKMTATMQLNWTVLHGWPSTQPGTCTQPCPIVHTAVPWENSEHGCVYLRCRAVCKLPGCVEGHPCIMRSADLLSVEQCWHSLFQHYLLTWNPTEDCITDYCT